MRNPVALEYFRRAEKTLMTPFNQADQVEKFSRVQALAALALAAEEIGVYPRESLLTTPDV